MKNYDVNDDNAFLKLLGMMKEDDSKKIIDVKPEEFEERERDDIDKIFEDFERSTKITVSKANNSNHEFNKKAFKEFMKDELEEDEVLRDIFKTLIN